LVNQQHVQLSLLHKLLILRGSAGHSAVKSNV